MQVKVHTFFEPFFCDNNNNNFDQIVVDQPSVFFRLPTVVGTVDVGKNMMMILLFLIVFVSSSCYSSKETTCIALR
jgi:hypothetical protein